MSTSTCAVPAPPASSASVVEPRCFAGELERGRRIAAGLDRAGGLHAEAVVAGGAFDIVELERQRAAIAREQEARQRRGQHHRIAHDDVDIGAADLGRGPRHRHHPRGAGEFRDVEGDRGGAVGADGDDAGIERQRLLRGRAALQFCAGAVTAGADLAARALHAVDQLPVEVADLRHQPALAEIVIVRRRRLVVGQVEDADIDRGDDDLGVFAGAEPAELDGQFERGRGPHEVRRRQRRRQASAPPCRSRTISSRWRGRACAAPPRRAAGAAWRPHRRRCPSPGRPAIGPGPGLP